jgi:phytoene dehydrogenase-like protein
LKYDTIIIGAGLSGLAAAVRLAHFGRRVAVLERHHRVGGLNSFYRRDGRDFDVGLHAMTNYAPAGSKAAPLKKLLRLLRIKWDDVGLIPQRESRTVFPGATLTFDNDPARLAASVADAFPREIDNYRRLTEDVAAFDDLDLSRPWSSAKERVASFIGDPQLVDMLFTPVMFYGSAEEDDMDYAQFVTIFKSVYVEGFARPAGGIRPILDLLLARCAESGVTIKLRTGVASIQTDGGRVTGVVTDNGDRIGCDTLLSSAGWPETVDLCPAVAPAEKAPRPGRMSFMESIHILDRPPAALGEGGTIIFFNRNERLAYRKPEEPVDLTAGVICCPGNFLYDSPAPDDVARSIRITSMADPYRWAAMSDDDYREAKAAFAARQVAAAAFATVDIAGHVVASDVFTPRTIERFTGHKNGAVYGSPDKLRSGITPVGGVYLIGTDQGYLGIVGSMLSGISISNLLFTDRT